MWTNGSLTPQKRTFARRQCAQYLLFFVFLSPSFTIRQPNIFSEMEPKGLKSELLFEDSGHKICHFCFSLNIFSNHFDYYCLMSINRFLRNGARNSQKRTFARRQWSQYLLFLFFTQHLFKSIWSQSIWLVLFAVNHFFLRNGVRSSQKRSFARRQWVQYLLLFSHLKKIVAAGIINGAIKCKLFVGN